MQRDEREEVVVVVVVQDLRGALTRLLLRERRMVSTGSQKQGLHVQDTGFVFMLHKA